MRIRILMLSILLGIMTSAIAANKAPSFTNPNKPIMVKSTAPTVTLRVRSNPTTGYSWFLVANYNNAVIMPLKHKYYAPTKAMPGAPGYEEWTFKVTHQGFVVPQLITLNLMYARPWNLTTSQTTTFKVVTYDS